MKIVIIVTILILPLISNGQSIPTLRDSALKCIDEGDFNCAIEKYNSLLKTNKNDFESLKNRAYCFEKINNFELAIKDNLVLLNFDKSGQTHARIAFEYMVLNQNIEARPFLEKAMILQPNEIKNQYNLGLTFQRENDAKRAIEIYNQVLLIDSLHIPTLVSKVRCLVGIEDFDQAKIVVDKFFNYQLFNEEMLILSGDINSNKGFDEAALKDYARALAILPNDVDILDKYSLTLSNLKLYNDEILLRDRIIKIMTESKGDNEDLCFEYRKKGLAQFSLGLHSEAKESLDKSIILYSKDPIAFFYRSIVNAILGDNEGGCLDLNKAKDISPDDALEFNQFFIDREEFEEFVEMCISTP